MAANTNSTTSFTLRSAPYTYYHLSLRHLAPTLTQAQQAVDEITTRSYLTSALQQYLGLTGTAISIDILKVQDRHVWIRVPREDEPSVTASISQWVGIKDVAWRIEGKAAWLGGLVGRGGRGREVWTMAANAG